MNEKSTKLLRGLHSLDRLIKHQEKARKTTFQLQHAMMIRAMEELSSMLDGDDHRKWLQMIEKWKHTPIDLFQRNMNIIGAKDAVTEYYMLRFGFNVGDNLKVTPAMHAVLMTILNAPNDPAYASDTSSSPEPDGP